LLIPLPEVSRNQGVHASFMYLVVNGLNRKVHLGDAKIQGIVVIVVNVLFVRNVEKSPTMLLGKE